MHKVAAPHPTKASALLTALSAVYAKRHEQQNFAKEEASLRDLIPMILDRLTGSYDIIEPFALGGAGILWKVIDTRSPSAEPLYRALKTPRPIQGVFTSVTNEAKTLLSVRHANIIPIHYAEEVILGSDCFSFFVMDYIEGGQSMEDKVHALLDDLATLKGQSGPGTAAQQDLLREVDRQIASSIQWFVNATGSIASALAYLHEQGIVHFDMKPANVLVDSGGTALLADLGYAKSKNQDQGKDTQVGFTEAYAHPDLLSGRFRSTRDKSGNRCHRVMRPDQFREEWDIYAFGKSILHMLNLFHKRNRTVVSLSHSLSYLHLAACRMLDGHNRPNAALRGDRGDHSYFEEWRGLAAGDFGREALKYSSAKAVATDFAKLTGGLSIEEYIPELAVSYRQRIQTDHIYPAAFSRRVEALVSHPAFSRLRLVPQLGLVSYVYPTAVHTRFEHSLGAFSYACEYVKGLWHDEDNPLFKQWMTIDDIKALLAAALLHDIGHFPLAHDIEGNATDGHEAIFGHVDIGVRYVHSDIRDPLGRTIASILEDCVDGWGVAAKTVTDIITATKVLTNDIFDVAVPPKAKFLANILSGSLDVDKLDYLIRDSHACNLCYGYGIDIQRLLRTLTTSVQTRSDALHPDDVTRSRRALEVAVYEKGRSAAEAIGFARYLLYQSVYSHHAVRAIKVMLQAATADLLSGNRKHVRAVTSRFERMLGLRPSRQTDTFAHLSIEIADVLAYLEDCGGAVTKELVALVQSRRLYKRIITVHRDTAASPTDASTYRRIEDKRDVVLDRLREELQRAFSQERDKSKETIDNPGNIASDRVMALLSQPHGLLLDIPEASYGSPLELCIIPELEGLKRNDDAKLNASQAMAKQWKSVYDVLMKSVCKIRIYCHPDIRDTLTAVLGYEELNRSLQNALS